MTAIVFVVFLILYIIMTSVGSVEDTTAVGIGQEDENKVEQVLFDRMWQDLQIGSDHDFFMLQRLFDVDLRRLEPRTVSYINHIFKSTGTVIPIDNDLISLDCTSCIWQELCDFYPEELLSQLHEATVLQLFILLPYEIEEGKIQSFDSLNRTEFLEKPGTRSFMDHDGVIRSTFDVPLWGNDIPVGVLSASVCASSVPVGVLPASVCAASVPVVVVVVDSTVIPIAETVVDSTPVISYV